jgi:hypothetical protein
VSEPLPIGVCLGTIRATAGWWIESAKRLEAAGYRAVWALSLIPHLTLPTT